MKTLIIAEAGVNHNGDIAIAKKMIEVAAQVGADLVKFQTFVATNFISRYAPKAEYQKLTTVPFESQLDMISKLELSRDNHIELIEECKKNGIGFCSTAFDKYSIDLLDEVGGNNIVKIPSGEITNLPYLRHLARNRQQVLLSTGMATLGEIEEALDAIEQVGTPREKITILQCTTDYPAALADVNLLSMTNMGSAFGVKVGYSDHTVGIEVPIAAVALGATIIEKHFTLDRNLPGPDHLASLEPDEFTAMVKGIRNIEKALGDGIKRPTVSELKNRAVARKSIVAARSIKAGEVFCEENITTKRPGTGISPMRWDDIIGRTATRDFNQDEFIE